MGNPNPYFAVRAGQDPMGLVTDIRAIAKQLNPAAMMDNIATMEQVVSNSLSRPRLFAVLFGILAAIAGGLAAIGVYGIIAYSVERRTREIGIRLALGATRADVIRLVLGQTCVVTAVGIGVGITGATAGSRYLDTLLFGLRPLDPITFIGVATLFVTAATFASFMPARRAAKIDPTVALRSE